MAHVKTKELSDGTKRYELRYRVDGSWKAKTYRRKEDALAAKMTVEADLVRGDWLDPALARTPFSQVADDWLETKANLKERTRAGYRQLLRNHVLPTFGRTPVGKITTTSIKAWVASLQSHGVGPSMIRNTYRTVLKPILDSATESNLIRTNPAPSKLDLPRLPKYEALFLTPTQVTDLANAIQADLPQPIGQMYRTLILFAAYTGLRAGELCALRVGQLDLMRKVVHVNESVTLTSPFIYGPTKTYAERKVNLPAFLTEPLMELTANRPQDAFVFRSPRRPKLIYGTFYSGYFRPAAQASLPPNLHALRFHDLRHTAAALMVNQSGADAIRVSRRMGHSSIKVTYDIYAKLFPEADQEIVDGLDAAYQSSVEPRAAEAVGAAILEMPDR